MAGNRRAVGGWRVDVTVTASSAAWANRCAHTGSIDPPVCCRVCVPGYDVRGDVIVSAVRLPSPRLPFTAPLLSAPSYATTAVAAATHGTVLI